MMTKMMLAVCWLTRVVALSLFMVIACVHTKTPRASIKILHSPTPRTQSQLGLLLSSAPHKSSIRLAAHRGAGHRAEATERLMPGPGAEQEPDM